MIMDPNQLEDADRRGINPYEESYLAATYNRRQELGATVAQATGEPSPGAGSWGDYPPVDDGPDEFPPPRFSPFPVPVPAPDEPAPGSVIGFVKDYGNGTLYQYVAVRVEHAGWFLTGPRAPRDGRSWAAVLQFIGEPADWATVGVVSAWDRLVP
jgi:hypothetical protein